MPCHIISTPVQAEFYATVDCVKPLRGALAIANAQVQKFVSTATITYYGLLSSLPTCTVHSTSGRAYLKLTNSECMQGDYN